MAQPDKIKYSVVEGWEQLPKGYTHRDVAGVAVDAEDRVYVCDRESDRIQIFSPDGEYLSEWTDTQRPTHLCFDSLGRAYVTELAWYEGDTSHGKLGKITKDKTRHARMSIYDKNHYCPVINRIDLVGYCQ